jgi:hypothetical protein
VPDKYQLIRTTAYENTKELGEYKMGDGPAIFPAMSITTMISYDPVVLTMVRPDDVSIFDTDGEQQAVISGISNGDGGIENLTLDYVIEDASLLTGLSLSSIGINGEATLTFSPKEGTFGQTKVTLTLSDDNGNVRSDVFYIIVSKELGGVEGLDIRKMRIYPNPSDGNINIDLPGEGYQSLSIMDITGKKLKTFYPKSDFIHLDLSMLQRGLYLIEVNGNEGKLVEQILIQ